MGELGRERYRTHEEVPAAIPAPAERTEINETPVTEPEKVPQKVPSQLAAGIILR